MKLSKHVTLLEFEYSDAAIRHSIPNKMNATQLAKAIDICEAIFEPLRAHFGKPIRINSGFRSVAVNRRIGGSSTSQHCKGEALDLDIGLAEFLWIKENLPYNQLIFEFGTDTDPGWIHVSFKKGAPKRPVLRAVKIKGKTVYVNY